MVLCVFLKRKNEKPMAVYNVADHCHLSPSRGCQCLTRLKINVELNCSRAEFRVIGQMSLIG